MASPQGSPKAVAAALIGQYDVTYGTLAATAEGASGQIAVLPDSPEHRDVLTNIANNLSGNTMGRTAYPTAAAFIRDLPFRLDHFLWAGAVPDYDLPLIPAGTLLLPLGGVPS